MHWVVLFALAAMALCAVLAATAPTVDTTYLTPEFASTFTFVVGLSREFCRRILMSLKIDHALMARARAIAVEQLHTFHLAGKALLTPYVSVCRHIITDAIEKYPLLRLAEEYLLPQPSYENLTFHAERGACVWTKSSTGLPADFSPHTGTLFLLLATNVCTAVFCLSIGATILAPLRIVWRSTKARVSPAGKPKATWETVLEDLAPVLANLAAAGINGLALCTTGLLFCIGNIVTYAASLDFGLLMKRSAPQAEPPRVFYKTLPDPRVPQLEEKARKLENEMKEKDKNFQAWHQENAATIHDLYGKNDVLEKANAAQKLILRGHMKMHGSIDLTRPMYEQLMETQQQRDNIQGDYNRAVEEKIEMQNDFWKQLSDKCEDMRLLKKSLRAQKEEHAALLRSQEYLQDRASRGDEVARVQIEFQKGRIQELEKLMASQKETLEARIKELHELVTSHEATIKSLEAQLKQRDEANNTQKEAKQALEARIKEQDARHSSEQKSQKAHLMKGFEREKKKLVDLSRLSSEARKAAEEKYKAADEARKVADEARETAEQARKTEEEARKTAEKDSAASLEARKAAEDACKVAEEKLEAAEKALKAAEDARKAAEEESAANLKALQAAEESLKVSEEARKAAEDESASLREQLANRPPSHDKGTQASSPPPSPSKAAPIPPSTTPPDPPVKAPARPLGKGSCPPKGQRPFLPAVSVRNKVGAKKNPLLKFNVLAPITPNIPGTNPAAPPPAMPTALDPIAPKPTTPPATPSAPAPSTPEPTTPEAAPSTPEHTNLPPLPSTPEPTTPTAAPSTAETAPAEGSPGKSSGGSGESKQPEAVNSAPAEASPAKPASPSGEAPEDPEPASA
ncbi:hypothetical protein LA080_004888 [Diaporthe eres]|uniref:Uncharacterized protein n=1 Tax=Diaporthe vaccinii TaxID=105482 RepID=A0ABR4EHF7_9PEZI|nr:hypothetical protein LA080_004888 [Diaporthe eres]